MVATNRRKILIINTYTSIAEHLVIIISGFILPKLILKTFGSDVNGLISSITQFISVITFLELGVGTVIQSTLYKPLATNDNAQISRIVKSGQKFFNTIGTIFIVYLVILVAIYPGFVISFDKLYVIALILILSLSSIFQYFIGITYQLLLLADQKIYVTKIISIIVVVLNTVISILLIKLGSNIQIVKLFSSSIFILKPVLTRSYVNRHYEIDNTVKIYEEPIKQKWNGMAQHLAYFVLRNTDIMVLTFFSSLKTVSVYAIYNMVVVAIEKIIVNTTAGFRSLFGNMLAKEENDRLLIRFKQFEWGTHTIVTLLFTCAALLITPFITIYTQGIQDTNYIQPTFGILLSIATAFYCIRIPYNTMIFAAGHYKETQLSAIIEMVLNISISILLVKRFDLIGVAIGTAIAMVYRTVYLAIYLSKNIIHYKITGFLKNILIDIISVLSIVLIASSFKLLGFSYLSWILLALKTFFSALVVVFIVNTIFYKDKMRLIYNSIKVRFTR